MPKKPRKPPGPEPERLVIKGNWEAALKKAVRRNDPPKKKGKKKKRDSK
jgi:hypothetical protein